MVALKIFSLEYLLPPLVERKWGRGRTKRMSNIKGVTNINLFPLFFFFCLFCQNINRNPIKQTKKSPSEVFFWGVFLPAAGCSAGFLVFLILEILVVFLILVRFLEILVFLILVRLLVFLTLVFLRTSSTSPAFESLGMSLPSVPLAVAVLLAVILLP